jgi:hypothetical protein
MSKGYSTSAVFRIKIREAFQKSLFLFGARVRQNRNAVSLIPVPYHRKTFFFKHIFDDIPITAPIKKEGSN